jgi:hypothetical protein
MLHGPRHRINPSRGRRFDPCLALLDASELAAFLKVERSFVYEHAD